MTHALALLIDYCYYFIFIKLFIVLIVTTVIISSLSNVYCTHCVLLLFHLYRMFIVLIDYCYYFIFIECLLYSLTTVIISSLSNVYCTH